MELISKQGLQIRHWQHSRDDEMWGLASAAEVAVVANDGARAPVEAAAKLVPDSGRVLVRRAAVVQHAVPQHLQPRALQLCHTPAQPGG